MQLPIQFDGWTIDNHPEPRIANYCYQHDSHDSVDFWLNGSGNSISECIEDILETYYQRQEGW